MRLLLKSLGMGMGTVCRNCILWAHHTHGNGVSSIFTVLHPWCYIHGVALPGIHPPPALLRRCPHRTPQHELTHQRPLRASSVGPFYLDALTVQIQTKSNLTVECFADLDARTLVPRSAFHPSTLMYDPSSTTVSAHFRRTNPHLPVATPRREHVSMLTSLYHILVLVFPVPGGP